jgi:hypothetical protein
MITRTLIRHRSKLLSPTLCRSLSTEEKGFFRRLYDSATSDAAKKERQKQLNAELEDGVFPQFKEFRKTSGKLFRADNELISRGAAPIFPATTADTLAGEQVSVPPSGDTVCLVGLAYNQHALKTFETWRSAYLESLGMDAPMLELTITESSFLSMFSSSVNTSLKNTVDEDLHRNHVPIFDLDYNQRLKDSLLITNTIPLYVFLVENSYVRWRGTGEADSSEIESMIRCARQLNDGESEPEQPKWQSVGTAA